MDDLELQLPTLSHKQAAENFKSEFFDMQEPVIYGSALFDQMEFEQWLAHNTNNRQESTVSTGWVPATTFFAVRKREQKIVGIIDIRHNLENEFLAQYGGHFGYSVRPSERKKGYATEILKMGIEYAKSLNIEKLMIACFSTNLPSIKTILKCGAVLSEVKLYSNKELKNAPYIEEKLVNIYWLDLKNNESSENTTVKLRKWNEADLGSLVKHANNSNVAKWLTNGFPHPYTQEDGKAFLSMIAKDNPTKVFAIEVNGEAVGSIGIFPQTDIHEKSAEMGYWLAEKYWGQGITTKAITEIVEYGFQTFDIVRIFARPFSTNLNSQRVLEKAGFTLEAILKKALFKNGAFMDELIYAKLKE